MKILNKMKKKYFDIIMILIIALFLILLAVTGLIEYSAKFMLIPILAAYYIGQYSQRKFKD